MVGACAEVCREIAGHPYSTLEDWDGDVLVSELEPFAAGKSDEGEVWAVKLDANP